MKTSGRIAFEAYRSKKQGVTYDAKQIPAWEELGDDVRNAWEAAAEAVIVNMGIAESPWSALKHAYAQCKSAKPNDRSEADRRFAVLIAKLEDVLAHYRTWIAEKVEL
jgi:hypothetical protein